MREKIKNMLLGISIFYVVSVLTLTGFNVLNADNKISLNDDTENINKLNVYKVKVNSLKDSECKNIINEIINNYEKSSYNGEVEIKEVMNNLMPLTVANEAKDACKITSEEIEDTNFLYKFVSLNMPFEETFTKYKFQYELHLKDIASRNFAEPMVTNIIYNTQRKTWLEIINNLIKYAKKDGSLMKRNYLILYYLSFVLTIGYSIYNYFIITTFGIMPIYYVNFIALILNIIMVIIVSLNLKKLNDVNFLFPLFYIILIDSLFLIGVYYNRFLIYENMQFNYYFKFIILDYLLLNIYTLISLKKN